jgi:hypothetical protein
VAIVTVFMWYEYIPTGRKNGGQPRREKTANIREDGRNLE